jgi:AcrR family transcriptional regulator
MSKAGAISATRDHILQAALKSFAEYGYAATSVQHIVDAAQVSKPALYYYFKDKAELFQALVDRAHDERLRMMQEAAARGGTFIAKMEELVIAAFTFSSQNRELMRLAFATAFAGPGEIPVRADCHEKRKRNFEFIQSLLEEGQKTGELASTFTSEELAMSIHGQLITSIVMRLLAPDCPATRQTARQMVRLFLEGAAPRNAASPRRHLAAA